ncbi:EF-P lysine aminoacylase EpmA [Desulfacinum hydrothermale]|nr:EF-P lysine aminoacylase EpmA [Desulfacinum hydrothermale]
MELAAKRPYLEMRSRILHGLRLFFTSRGFLEVQTPVRTPAPAPELHIDPLESEGWYLNTSPELYMKRLLAAGYEKIFQMGPVFRKGERGSRHHPEFTLLEWYRAGADYTALKDDCRHLLRFLCRELGLFPHFTFRGNRLRVDGPWQDVTVRQAFTRYAGWDPVEADDPDRFDLDLVEQVEPHLGFPTPTFLSDYPRREAALARIKASDPSVAERFELYWAGIELANGFSELTDRHEQKDRFLQTLHQRRKMGLATPPLPRRFLESLDHLDQAAGIALGVDRLVMVLTDAPDLDHVVAFAPDHEP